MADIASGLAPHVGDTRGRTNARYLHAPKDTTAELASGLTEGAADGMTITTKDGYSWRFDAASTLTEDGILVVGSEAAGRWLRAAGTVQMLTSAPVVAGSTLDGAALFTLPAGCILKPLKAWWNVTVAFSGGTSSAIGIDSDNLSLATPGDILGGAAGDLLADLTVGEGRGTIGTLIDDPEAILEPTNVVRFQEMVSAFTTGTATLRLLVYIVQNAGA